MPSPKKEFNIFASLIDYVEFLAPEFAQWLKQTNRDHQVLGSIISYMFYWKESETFDLK